MKFFKILIILSFTVFFFNAKAGVEPILTGKRQGSAILIDSVVTVIDDKYTCILADNCSPKFKTPVLKNMVLLGIDHDNITCYQAYSFTVTLELEKFHLNTPSVGEIDTITLTLSWNPNAGIISEDKAVYNTEGYIKINSKILNYVSTLAGNAVPDNIYIEGLIKKERYYALNYASQSSIISITENQDDELVVIWNPVSGAEEYDLEYMYIDDFGDYDNTSGTSYKSLSNIPVDFRNNATRVTVNGTSHKIKNLYQHGYLLFRVRFVGLDTVRYAQRIESRWSSHSYGNTLATFGATDVDKFAITDNHEDTLNWQWTTSFAEEGKNKTVISYFDGSLRSRQMVTYTNTDQLTIVAESFYDHVGRKVVDALPVPTGDSIIKFYRNFNLSATTQQTYSWKDFDTSATMASCINNLAGMDTIAGASRYYSHNNKDKNLFQAYVPDANQYPFVQVEFMPDNTGRVRKQSGVGYEHRMGSGHETQYFYGKPTQQELDMLFGVEVGDYNRYKKNMVVDPNGSISVSYLNPSGKVIATALAGENPSNLSVLSTDTATQRLVQNLQYTIPAVDTQAMTIKVMHDILLSTTQEVEFNYKIKEQSLNMDCSPNICYDCIYDLKFSVTNDCGEKLYDTTFIAVQPFDTVCANDSFEHSFSLALDKGAYRVYKELSVNLESLEYYEEVYLRNNTCENTLQEIYDDLVNNLDYSDCENSCTSCLDKLGTLANYKTSRYGDLDTTGLDQDSLISQFTNEYNLYVEECNELCDTPSVCEAEYLRLLQDVAPGGQYAGYFHDTGEAFFASDHLSFYDTTTANDFPDYMGMQRDFRNDSLVYYNSNGDTAKIWYDSAWVRVNDLPDSLFLANWDPEWAKTLVKLHPEYCYYEWCILNAASNNFDNRIRNTYSYADALADSLLDPLDINSSTFPNSVEDPFFKTGGLGAGVKSTFSPIFSAYASDGVNAYTMWEAAAVTVSCKGDSSISGTSSCLAANPFGSGTTAAKDEQWEVFKSFYLAEKQKYIDIVRTNYAYANYCANCFIGHDGQALYSTSCTTNFNSDSLIHKQKQYPSIRDITNIPLDSGTNEQIIDKGRLYASTRLESECASQCEAYADNWMRALAGCNASASDSAAVRDSLINICKLGCDEYNPLGANEVSPQNLYKVKNKNFREVVESYFATNALCNSDLISFPYSYNHNYAGSDSVPMDSCFKNILKTTIAEFGCTWTYEVSALSMLFKDLAANAKFKTSTEIDIQPNVNSGTWTNFTNYLMPYTNGLETDSNTYVTDTLGGNLVATIKSLNGGSWYSCAMILETPENYTLGFFDSINSGDYSIDSLVPNPNYSISPPYRDFIVYVVVGSDTIEVKGFSDCYKVCSDSVTMQENVTNAINTTYCKNFTVAQVKQMLKVLYGDPYAVAFIPADLSCKPKCITCDKLYAANTAFWNDYDGTVDLVKEACVKSNELYALETIFKKLAITSGLSLNMLTPKRTDQMGTSVAYQFEDYLRSYSSSSLYATHEYISSVSGTDLVARLRSLISGEDSCVITFQLPAGYTTGFYDSIRVGGYAIDSVMPDPAFESDQFSKEFIVYVKVGGISVEMKGTSGCYPVCRRLYNVEPDISCNPSNELGALETIFKKLSTSQYRSLNMPTPIRTDHMGTTVAYQFEDYLRVYSSPSTFATHEYITSLSGTDLVARLRSLIPGEDSCIITFNLPEGYTTSLYDSISLGMWVIDYLEPDPDYLSTDPYRKFIMHLSLGGTELEMKGYSSCYPVCNPSYSLVYDTSFSFTDIYANYMNTYLGLNQDYYAYEELKANCDSFYITDTTSQYYNYLQFRNEKNGCGSLNAGKLDTLMNKLSLCDKAYAWQPDTISCDSNLRLQAYDEALRTYKAQLDTLKGKFRRAYIQKCLGNAQNLNETYDMAYDIKQYHYTLYYYDQADNLVKTVPPAGVRQITNADTLAMVQSDRANKVAANYYNTPHHNLGTNYKYNTLNAVYEQTTPDGGTTNFFYDRLGRLAVSQNEKQQTAIADKYSYTLYDELGRITEVGETVNITAMDDATSRSAPLLAAWHGAASLNTQITRTYYDNKADALDSQFEDSAQQNLRNRVAYIAYDEDGTGNYDYATYYSYDIHGNVKELVHDYSPLQPVAFGYFKLKYQYDLISGNVNKVSYQAGQQDQFYHQYVYDADNRINQVYTSRDGVLQDNDAKYYYYQHGPLARAEVGELKVQGMDYAYTIHGWLKGVNSNTLDSSRDIGKDGWWDANNSRRYIPKDEYGFTLGYYAGDYTAIAQHSTTQHFEMNVSGGFSTASPSLYNGNIRHMVTAIGKFMEGGKTPMGYAYKYDHLNRLASMDAYDSANLAGNAWYTAATSLSQYHNRFTYDANGNILSQVRHGSVASGIALDSLTYNYIPNTNKLSHVNDIVNDTNYSDDIDNQSAGNYTYDAIGNLISDAAEEIDTIAWNVYGKITRIVRDTASTKPKLTFSYGPDGNRIMKRVDYPNDTAHRSFIEYYVRDAQGNIMATYTTSDPYYEPIDTSYEKIISKLIQNKGLSAFAGFIQARFAADTAFYNRLGTYIPDSAMIDSFSISQLLYCGGDALYQHLFGCCGECGTGAAQQVMYDVLHNTGSNGYSIVEELLSCKPELVLNAILQDNGSNLLTDIGSSARAALYAHFLTVGYKHSNSSSGDTINFLLLDVPLGELAYYMAYSLAGNISMTQADYIEAIADVMQNMYATLSALHTVLGNYIPACQFIDCMGKCLTLANGDYSNAASSICSNIATNYLQTIYSSNSSTCGYSYDSLKQHLQTAPLRGFMHSRMQQCQSNAYDNKLVQNLIDRTSYATLYNAGIRLTEWGFKKYIYDSLITQIAHPDMIDQLWLCNADTLLYAIGQYNIKLLIEAIAAYSPAGTNYLNATWATLSSTYPNPAGLARNQYLAQVVPKNVLLAHIKANYSNWVSNLGDQLTQADMVRMISQYYPRCDFETCIWNKVDDGTLAFDSSQLIQYTKNHYWSYLMERLYENNADTFTLQAAYTRPKIIVDLFERWHLPLSTFMDEVETHFDLATRNAIDVDTIKKVQYLWVNEWNMYGSSRLGTYQAQSDTVRGVIRSYNHRVSNDTVAQAYFAIDTLRYNKFLVDSIHHLHKGRKRYEGTNHLGNVLVVFSDKRLQICTNDTIHYYRADVVNAYEYSPFGAIMPDRKWDSDTTLKYRFGFNGMERDDEAKGDGNSLDFGSRMYDSRLGRWMSLDPLWHLGVEYTPYNYSLNSPIYYTDPSGNWVDVSITKYYKKKNGEYKVKKWWHILRRAARKEIHIKVGDVKVLVTDVKIKEPQSIKHFDPETNSYWTEHLTPIYRDLNEEEEKKILGKIASDIKMWETQGFEKNDKKTKEVSVTVEQVGTISFARTVDDLKDNDEAIFLVNTFTGVKGEPAGKSSEDAGAYTSGRSWMIVEIQSILWPKERHTVGHEFGHQRLNGLWDHRLGGIMSASTLDYVSFKSRWKINNSTNGIGRDKATRQPILLFYLEYYKTHNAQRQNNTDDGNK